MNLFTKSATLMLGCALITGCSQNQTDNVGAESAPTIEEGVTLPNLTGNGSEPPWTFTYTGQQVTFVIGYDEEAFTFSDVKTSGTPENYKIEASEDLSLSIKEGNCLDMAENAYNYDVTVMWKGEQYFGCANAL